ncbi:MAG: hypothetical protein L6R35_007062 [Caloplaca aegaea]|nr:MAG: hypothetical protein L6R35_007062 [Caloplaca aegaea]
MLPTTLSSLPCEIRTQIIQHLLPSVSNNIESLTAKCTNSYAAYIPTSLYSSPPLSPTSPWPPSPNHNSKNTCTTAILALNRAFHLSGTRHLYALRTFTLTVWPHAYDFLYRVTELKTLPRVPYSTMKEFTIQLPECNIATLNGCLLRRNLVWLCGLLAAREYNDDDGRRRRIHFRRLKIEFLTWESESDPMEKKSLWDMAWDADDDEEEEEEEGENADKKKKKPDEGTQEGDWRAYVEGFSSTMAWLCSAFAMLPPGVADECEIVLPESIARRGYMREMARWYEEGMMMDGREGFEEEKEEDWCLRKDKEWFEREVARVNEEGEEC